MSLKKLLGNILGFDYFDHDGVLTIKFKFGAADEMTLQSTLTIKNTIQHHFDASIPQLSTAVILMALDEIRKSKCSNIKKLSHFTRISNEVQRMFDNFLGEANREGPMNNKELFPHIVNKDETCH